MLPGLRASHDLEDVWVCKVVPEIRRKISLAFRKGEKRGPALESFLTEIIRQADMNRGALPVQRCE